MRLPLVFIAGLAACGTSDAPEPRPGERSQGTSTGAEPILPTVPDVVGWVVINELQPRNESTLPSPGADPFPDWVELVNTTADPIPWSRVSLSDGGAPVVVPLEGELLPGVHTVLFTDLLGIGLSGDGETLDVYVDRSPSDQVGWTAQPRDVSVARVPDLSGELLPTATPSPGAPNPAPSASLDAADATVFVADQVHTIDFVVAEDLLDELAEGDRFIGTFNDYQEVEASVVIDGIHFPRIGLRRKGSASTDPLSGKPPFVVDLNAFVPGTRFRTLKEFNLNNGKVLDPTLLHEHLSYTLARASGIAAPRVGWAVVSLNGLDYGIYALVERHDDVFIERNFPGSGEQGVVLEPNETSDGNWLSGGDFGGRSLAWDFEEGPVPVDPAMIATVEQISDLVKGPASDDAIAELWTLADRDTVTGYFAWENVVGHHDGYHVPNNWRVYVDPQTLHVHLLPSGADWTWDQRAGPWAWGGRLASWCLKNAGCEADVARRMVEIADTVDAIALADEYDRIYAGIEPLLLSQPRPNHSANGIRNADMRTRVTLEDFPANARRDACERVPSVCP